MTCVRIARNFFIIIFKKEKKLFAESSGDAEQGCQNGKEEVQNDQWGQETSLTQTFGGAIVDDHLRDVTQQEQHRQCGEIISGVMHVDIKGKRRWQESQGDKAAVKQKL